MLTRGSCGIRAGTFIIPIPGALASDETAPSVRSSAQRSSTTMSLPSRPLVRGTSRSKVTDAHRQRLRRAVRFRCRWRPIPNFTRPRTRSSNPVPSSGESGELTYCAAGSSRSRRTQGRRGIPKVTPTRFGKGGPKNACTSSAVGCSAGWTRQVRRAQPTDCGSRKPGVLGQIVGDLEPRRLATDKSVTLRAHPRVVVKDA